MRRAFLVLFCLVPLTTLLFGCGGSSPPSITSQPSAVISNCGQTAYFSVAAAGTAPLNYQWRWNGFDLVDGGGGGRVSGANTSNLTITNLQSGDTGSISVAVSNSAGSTTSISVNLVVRDTLSFGITWPYDDLDIGVWEPDGDIFYSPDEYSDNGVFGYDYVDGGTEVWVLYNSHQTGVYNLKIWDWDYTGSATISVWHNGYDTAISGVWYGFTPGNIYTFSDINVVREGGKPALKFHVTEEPIPPGAAKPESAAPRTFGS